jgi:hypothetical protein
MKIKIDFSTNTITLQENINLFDLVDYIKEQGLNYKDYEIALHKDCKDLNRVTNNLDLFKDTPRKNPYQYLEINSNSSALLSSYITKSDNNVNSPDTVPFKKK